MHLKAGSGHLAQGGHGGQGFGLGHAATSGHLGQTGGTTSDFRIYKSSSPSGISSALTPIASLNGDREALAKITIISNSINKCVSLNFIIYTLARKRFVIKGIYNA